jgi:hypothetical protein
MVEGYRRARDRPDGAWQRRGVARTGLDGGAWREATRTGRSGADEVRRGP